MLLLLKKLLFQIDPFLVGVTKVLLYGYQLFRGILFVTWSFDSGYFHTQLLVLLLQILHLRVLLSHQD